jgi:hypothetical protein
MLARRSLFASVLAGCVLVALAAQPVFSADPPCGAGIGGATGLVGGVPVSKPEAAPAAWQPRTASFTDADLVAALVELLNETKDDEVGTLAITTLAGLGSDAKYSIPAIIRNAGRLGLLVNFRLVYDVKPGTTHCSRPIVLHAIDQILGNESVAEKPRDKDEEAAQSKPTCADHELTCTRTAFPARLDDLLIGEAIRGCVRLGMGLDDIQKVFGECPLISSQCEFGGQTERYSCPRYGISFTRRTYCPEKGLGGGIGREWRIFWMNDQPSHLTPEHLRGGIGP